MIAVLWIIAILATVFLAAFLAAAFRLSAMADQRQERRLLEIEAERASRLAECPWPEKFPAHSSGDSL